MKGIILGEVTVIDKMRETFSPANWIFLSTTLTGVVGVLILLAFLSLVLSGATLFFIFPGVIAFNGALGGYTLVDKDAGGKLRLWGFAFLLSTTGYFAISFICPWELVIDVTRILVVGFCALSFTLAGAWLARKSKSLKNFS